MLLGPELSFPRGLADVPDDYFEQDETLFEGPGLDTYGAKGTRT